MSKAIRGIVVGVIIAAVWNGIIFATMGNTFAALGQVELLVALWVIEIREQLISKYRGEFDYFQREISRRIQAIQALIDRAQNS